MWGERNHPPHAQLAQLHPGPQHVGAHDDCSGHEVLLPHHGQGEQQNLWQSRPHSFCLPYPLDPLLIFPGASQGLRQNHFDMGEEDVFDVM